MRKQTNKLSFLNNWLVKVFVVILFPFVISIIDNFSDWKNQNGQWNNIFTSGKMFVILLALLYIIYIIYVAYEEYNEEKEKKFIESVEQERDSYKEQIDIYNMVLNSLNILMSVSQKDINDLSKKIIATDNLDLLNWNFESISNYICNDIVNVLRKACKSGNDITANIYIRHKKKTNKRTQDYIRMIAHAGGINSTPKILYTDILLKKKKDWQYARLFLENNPKIVVYPTEEEIKQNFNFKVKSSKYDGEYTQYIGIPISCSSGNIISSLEIISHHGTIIADSKEEILELLNKYIIVYRNYALLTHKIEKGLRAKGGAVVNKEGVDEKKNRI